MAPILQVLETEDRLRASCVCRAWNRAAQRPETWAVTALRMRQAKTSRVALRVASRHGHAFRELQLEIDQHLHANRQAALDLLPFLPSNLRSLVIRTVGVNPLFYSGADFLKAFQDILAKFPDLEKLDLGELSYPANDDLLEVIAKHLSRLRYLDISTSPIICQISEPALLNVVESCPKLEELRILKAPLSDRILQSLPSTLRHLRLVIRGEEKYSNPLAKWNTLKKTHPNLKVELEIAADCPSELAAAALSPDVPCVAIRIEAHGLEEALRNHAESLESIFLLAAKDEQVLSLSASCPHLRYLHVLSQLQPKTVRAVLQQHPNLISYTLRPLQET